MILWGLIPNKIELQVFPSASRHEIVLTPNETSRTRPWAILLSSGNTRSTRYDFRQLVGSRSCS